MPNKKRLPAANTSMYRSANLMCRAVDGRQTGTSLPFRARSRMQDGEMSRSCYTNPRG